MKLWFARTAAISCNTVGRSSTTEMSTVSICGQDGKPRSAMTAMLVWRTRLNSELIAGFRISDFTIFCSEPAQIRAAAPGQSGGGVALEDKVFNAVIFAILALAALVAV